MISFASFCARRHSLGLRCSGLEPSTGRPPNMLASKEPLRLSRMQRMTALKYSSHSPSGNSSAA
eukprot:CAMPEP_0179838392 /NCGR_PEP_ID=MMETSP0982-20121206/653_1 /TAXON_ID=483367 /ORGANISM="non described non described, Strain CCMP 2436" /LENGTH=63 /DNA_ID=CAMNT_0021721763 /DNA_START=234 /DNA_END=425 /DNA_ORIENTATION=-